MPSKFGPSINIEPGSSPFDSLSNIMEGQEGFNIQGSRAQRNNNPGNLRSGLGQTGTDPDGFAVFPDVDTGRAALRHQIALESARGLNLGQFINKYAPPEENDTAQYLDAVTKGLGQAADVPLSSLGAQWKSPERIQREIEAHRIIPQPLNMTGEPRGPVTKWITGPGFLPGMVRGTLMNPIPASPLGIPQSAFVPSPLPPKPMQDFRPLLDVVMGHGFGLPGRMARLGLRMLGGAGPEFPEVPPGFGMPPTRPAMPSTSYPQVPSAAPAPPLRPLAVYGEPGGPSTRIPIWNRTFQFMRDIRANPQETPPPFAPIESGTLPSGRVPGVSRPLLGPEPAPTGVAPTGETPVIKPGPARNPTKNPWIKANDTWHSTVQEMNLPGAPSGVKAPGALTSLAKRMGLTSSKDFTADEIDSLTEFVVQNKRMPTPSEVSGIIGRK